MNITLLPLLLWCVVVLVCGPAGRAAGQVISLEVSPRKLPMGQSVRVEARIEKEALSRLSPCVLLPYVNQRRWGAPERPDAEGRASFLLPLPNTGPARVRVLAVPAETGGWMGVTDRDLLMVGRPMPTKGEPSGEAEVLVTWRAFPARTPSGTLFGMQWEPWFGPHGCNWTSAQAVPVTGFYNSTNMDVIRQHLLWFTDLGVDFVLADWSNHIWGKKHWDERGGGVNSILHSTQMALEVMAQMREEGIPVPKMVLMPGISNGPPATMEAFNELLEWVYRNYLQNPRFDGLWQVFDGKPLIVALDTGGIAHPDADSAKSLEIPFFKQTLGMSAGELDDFRAAQGPVNDTHFTVRWMSSQNQVTGHDKLGYWTWMDGILDAPATYRDGVAEAATVSTAFFDGGGWMADTAHGRRGGTTYVRSFNVALKHRPKVVLLHQFNEFAGQAPGHGYGPNHDIYVDSYSVEYCDDIEPVSLTADGYRGDGGGWGFFYLNLTQALMAVWREEHPTSTVLALDTPKVAADGLHLTWAVFGAAPEGYTVSIDGEAVAGADGTTMVVPTAGLTSGAHTATVIAKGARTRHALSETALDVPAEAMLPVVATRRFRVE